MDDRPTTLAARAARPRKRAVVYGTPETRFWAKVGKTEGCWLWKGRRTESGYGHFGIRSGKMCRAHRFSFELAYGPIPSGMYICHHCDNPPCVRPDHLFVGTNSDNAKDAIAKGRPWGTKRGTHCARGHEMTAANRYWRKDGYSQCRACRKLAWMRIGESRSPQHCAEDLSRC